MRPSLTRCGASGPFRNWWRPAAGLICMALIALAAGCQAVAPRERTVGVTLTGLDHLDAHLSIQNFWVDGVSGHQAGRGGRSVCCVSLPATWRPGLTVKVQWAVTDWRRKVYSMHERVVPVDRYDELGNLNIHFLRDGSVRAVSSMYAPWGEGGYYPGPSYDTVLKKRPWDIELRPGESFPQVGNAMQEPSPLNPGTSERAER